MADQYERKPQQLTGPEGAKELRVKYIDNGDGTWSLATTPMAVAPGAATSAKQDTTNIKLDAVISALGGSTSIDSVTMRKKSDDVDIIYIGLAPPGTAATDADWKIIRLDTNTLLDVAWADGDDSYDNIWDDRESLSYS